MTDIQPENKIYITSKTRMTAEAKIRLRATILHILGGWYSFCLIVLSLGEMTKTYTIPHSNILSLALAIALFALLFYVYGEKYHERADGFRSCYLKLQDIYNSNSPTSRKMAEYAKTLERYENHHSNDYDDMIFDAMLRGQQLQSATGVISVTGLTITKVITRRFATLAILAILFGTPVLVALKFGQSVV